MGQIGASRRGAFGGGAAGPSIVVLGLPRKYTFIICYAGAERPFAPALACAPPRGGRRAAHDDRGTLTTARPHRTRRTKIRRIAASVFLVIKTSALVSLLMSYAVGIALISLHASMRSPNLKARLENAQQEFRAAWRGQTPDYTL